MCVLADKSKYGIVTSQMHRFWRRCSYKSDFVFNTALVMHRMLLKKYNKQAIWSKVRAFLNQHPQMYGGKPIDFWIDKLKRKIVQPNTGAIQAGPFGQIQV